MRMYQPFCAAVVLFSSIVTAIAQPSGFGKDGGLQQVTFAQEKVCTNQHDRMVFGIKFQGCTAVVESVRKLDKLCTARVVDWPAFHNDRTSCFTAGDKADCVTAAMLCSKYDLESRSREGLPICTPRLGLALADEMHSSTIGAAPSRPLAANLLLIDITRGPRGSYGDLYTVDCGGNFCRVKAGCVGARAGRITSWLGSRGRYLASQWVQSSARSTEQESTGTAVDASRVSHRGDRSPAVSLSAEVKACLNISACLLKENVLFYRPTEERVKTVGETGNISIAVTLFIKDGTKIGPMEVPEHVLAAIAAAGSKESIVPNKAAAAAVGSIHGSDGGDGVSDFESRNRLSEGGPLWEWWTKQAVEGGLHKQKGHVIPSDIAAGPLSPSG